MSSRDKSSIVRWYYLFLEKDKILHHFWIEVNGQILTFTFFGKIDRYLVTNDFIFEQGFVNTNRMPKPIGKLIIIS